MTPVQVYNRGNALGYHEQTAGHVASAARQRGSTPTNVRGERDPVPLTSDMTPVQVSHCKVQANRRVNLQVRDADGPNASLDRIATIASKNGPELEFTLVTLRIAKHSPARAARTAGACATCSLQQRSE
eukprot:TRINITY_DN2360_c1_g3_i1.p2 TRINITY_DN2360_c1_g3~~TRINITY_DN2360_c1_g3_i1.p2  ORF type:complete len:129 (+),score=13.00 TRINITY_DN2360_c1_g3_i1:147-533(+)